MSKIIAFANHKGGTGKTTSAVNIAAFLQAAGKRVLIIDLDPQANISLSLGLGDPGDRNIYTAIKNEQLTEPHKYAPGGIDVICSVIDLAGAEMDLIGEAGREYILKELINEAPPEYDYILIDCPPSLGLLTINALTAAGLVIVPVQAEFLAVKGVAKITEVIEKVKRRLNPGLSFAVIVTRYSVNKVLNRNVLKAVQTTYKGAYLGSIRENIALAEAAATGQTIINYAPRSAGAADYLEITKKILEYGNE